jgi:hypothetical protein
MAGSRQGDGMLAICQRSAYSCYHAQFQEVCYQKLIILVQGHECLYNLQHKDYDNNLVKDNSWKEIAGELHAQDTELPRRTQHKTS